MFSSTLVLATEEGARITKRLANHWRHKMTVSESDNACHFPFSETDTAVISYDDTSLKVALDAVSQEAQEKLQSVIINHINRMAGSEFQALWQKTI